jgi:predicted polyphosphate/ATP-dependent NAD kinase
MDKPYLIIFLFLYSFISTIVILTFIFSKQSKSIAPVIIEKISSDTIYMELDSLKIKQDTIKIYYETKINDYRTMPTPKRVQLFAERANRQ